MLGVAASVCINYCARPVAGQFPAPPESAVFCCILMCALLNALIVLTVLHALEGRFGSLQMFFPIELLVQCNRVLGLELGVMGRARGWVAVGKACGVFLLPGVRGGQLQPLGSCMDTQPSCGTQTLT